MGIETLKTKLLVAEDNIINNNSQKIEMYVDINDETDNMVEVELYEPPKNAQITERYQLYIKQFLATIC